MTNLNRIKINDPMEALPSKQLQFEGQAIILQLVQEKLHRPARCDLRDKDLGAGRLALLLEGFVGRHLDDHLGHRQLVSLYVPGDFIDLQALSHLRQTHDLQSISAVHLAIIDAQDLWDILISHPGVARQFWAISMTEAAIHRHWIFRQGRLSARARLAHFLCEMNMRLVKVGLSDGRSFRLPLTQSDLAEICGLSAVHINRTLKELREKSLCFFRLGQVNIIDLPKLLALGQFHQNYLDPQLSPHDPKEL